MSYQFSDVKTLGDKSYFGLSISNAEGKFAPFSRYVFLTDYAEDFEAVWSIEPGGNGRIDKDYSYVSTNRKANLSFKLPAKNVAEAKENLDFCSKLAKTVYGSYSRESELTIFGNSRYRFEGANTANKIKFGNLIRNESCFFTDFSFTPNIDAGVFEFSETLVDTSLGKVPEGAYQDTAFNNDSAELQELSYVYHFDKGDVYPKEVNVTISVIILHNYPLGFGGPRRPGEPLKWAENENRDWPHGTGPTYPVPPYMSKDVQDMVISDPWGDLEMEEGSEAIEPEAPEAQELESIDSPFSGKKITIDENGNPSYVE